MYSRSLVLVVVLTTTLPSASSLSADQRIDFNRQIRPIRSVSTSPKTKSTFTTSKRPFCTCFVRQKTLPGTQTGGVSLHRSGSYAMLGMSRRWLSAVATSSHRRKDPWQRSHTSRRHAPPVVATYGFVTNTWADRLSASIVAASFRHATQAVRDRHRQMSAAISCGVPKSCSIL